MKIQTKEKTLLRDINSKALLNNDRGQLESYITKKSNAQKLKKLESEVEEIKNSLSEILKILKG